MDTKSETLKEKHKRQTANAIQARKLQLALARDNKSNNIVPPKTPISIRNAYDIMKVSKDMMSSLANKDGRFTVAEVRVFNTLVSIYYKTQEHIDVKRELKKMDRNNPAPQA